MIININFFKYTRSIRMTRFTNYLNKKKKEFFFPSRMFFAIHSSFSFSFPFSYVTNNSCPGSLVLFVRNTLTVLQIARIQVKEHILMSIPNDNTPVQSTYLNSIFLFCHSITTCLDHPLKK
jgi:hypothetical protein